MIAARVSLILLCVALVGSALGERALAQPVDPQVRDFAISDLNYARSVPLCTAVCANGLFTAGGTLRNNGRSPAGAAIMIIVHDESGNVITDETFWPAGAHNIPPGGAIRFEWQARAPQTPDAPLPSPSTISLVVTAVEVRVWEE